MDEKRIRELGQGCKKNHDNKGFSTHSDVDRRFLQRKNGGRGLVFIKDFYDRMCVSK